MNYRTWMVHSIFIAWIFVVISALMVVYCKFTLRSKVSELQMLSSSLNGVQVELGQLMLEQGTVASYERVEQISQESLRMRVPRYDEIVWLELPES